MRSKFYLLLLLGLNSLVSHAQVITTFAGTGTHSHTGDGDVAGHASFNNCTNVTFDGAGNIYITDRDNNVIRRVNHLGIIRTIAGNDTAGYSGDGAAATAAKLDHPAGVAIDISGNIYIADYGNNVIRRVDTGGRISTFAGNGIAGYSGDEDTAKYAEFNGPQGLATTESGMLFIADAGNHVVRMIDPDHVIHTIAGTGTTGNGGDGDLASNTQLGTPVAVATDAAENIYIADFFNNTVRKVDAATWVISTVAGNGIPGFSGDGGSAAAAQLRYPSGVSVDGAGNVFIADQGNNRIRKINTGGVISTFAGSTASGYFGDGGLAVNAQLSAPKSVAADGWGRVYVADYGNNVIRLVAMPAGVGQFAAANSELMVYPNPSTGSFTINLPGAVQDAKIIIADIAGRIIETRNITTTQPGTQSFELNGAPSGCYAVRLVTKNTTYTGVLNLIK